MNQTTRSGLGSSVPPPPPATTRDWRRIGLWLVGVTLAYNVLEGVLALWAGWDAGSIALVGFGFDSFIECAAATALFWRLGVEALLNQFAAEAGGRGIVVQHEPEREAGKGAPTFPEHGPHEAERSSTVDGVPHHPHSTVLLFSKEFAVLSPG